MLLSLDQPWPHQDAADATSVPKSCCPPSSVTLPMAHTLFLTGSHLLFVTVPQRGMSTMPQPQQQNRVISCQSWSMREKPAVLGPLNSTGLILCQDTASDGPGVNGRRAVDPHGGESASVAGGRKEGVRESTWGSRAFSHTCRAVRALSEARQSRGLTPRAKSPQRAPRQEGGTCWRRGKPLALIYLWLPPEFPSD